MKRERLEDLGRIREKLEYLNENIDKDISSFDFEEFKKTWCEKTCPEGDYFPYDGKHQKSLWYQIKMMDETLTECLIIARGHDDE